MKIQKVSFENVKARDLTFDLRSVNIFCGSNFSGKTAVLDAIKVGLLGYHPRLGKQHINTIDLAGENRLDMMIHLEMDTGESSTNTWRRKTDGTIKFDGKSDLPDIPPVLLDTREYFEMTAAERIMFVFKKIDISGMVIADSDLLIQLKAIEALPAKECEKAITELDALFQKLAKRRDSTKLSPQDWLASLIAGFDEERKAYSQKQKTTSAGMAQFKNASAIPKSNKPRIEELQKLMAGLRVQANGYTAQKKAYDDAESKRKELQEKAKGTNVDTAELEKQAETLENDIKILDDLRAEAKSIKAKMDSIGESMANNQKELDSIGSKSKCPTCRSKRQGWQDEWKAELTAEIAGLKANLDKLTVEYEAKIAAGKALKNRISSQDAPEPSGGLSALKASIKRSQEANRDRNLALAELNGLTSSLPNPDPVDVQKVADELSKLDKELTELLGAENVYDQFAANKEKMKALETELLGHQVRVDIFKKAIAIIVSEQERIVALAFDSILAAARKFTDGILPGQFGFKNGDLGMQTENGWVKHRVFSGTEEAIAYAGLSVALAQQSPVKVVIIDELGRMDPENKSKLIARMLELSKAGIVDNFIGADVTKDSYPANTGEFQIIVL